MAKIAKIYAQEILDSRGNPTVEVKVTLESGVEAVASVPSGASTGVHEALELRDGDKSRFNGKGVLKACQNVNTVISNVLVGIDVCQQEEIDRKMIELDGTENKSKLGANAILGVSLACARTAAKSQNLPLYKYICQTHPLQKWGLSRFGDSLHFCPVLPTPMFNIINGGKHAHSGLDIQEFMIVPIGIESFRGKLEAGKKIFQKLKELLEEKGYSLDIGDEGGFAPKLKGSSGAFEILVEAITKAGYSPGQDVSLAIDAAASEFFRDGKYLFEGKELSAEEMIEVYKNWLEKYSLISIEDGLAEDDWSGWQKLNSLGRGPIRSPFLKFPMLVGDDLFTTNIKRLKKGIDSKVANAILIKLNQIGTLSETINCVKLADKNNYQFIISHRSGETLDDFVADLAAGTGAGFIKAGAPNEDRRERMVKYERLVEIEKELRGKHKY